MLVASINTTNHAREIMWYWKLIPIRYLLGMYSNHYPNLPTPRKTFWISELHQLKEDEKEVKKLIKLLDSILVYRVYGSFHIISSIRKPRDSAFQHSWALIKLLLLVETFHQFINKLLLNSLCMPCSGVMKVSNNLNLSPRIFCLKYLSKHQHRKSTEREAVMVKSTSLNIPLPQT